MRAIVQHFLFHLFAAFYLSVFTIFYCKVKRLNMLINMKMVIKLILHNKVVYVHIARRLAPVWNCMYGPVLSTKIRIQSIHHCHVTVLRN